MKKIYKNGLYLLMAGALIASCADYNVTDDFAVEPDPSITQPYTDLATVKSYIDRSAYPNLTIGATLDITEFNKQELAHSAAIANFDNVSFGTSLMSGKIINSGGVMNFVALNDLLEHMDEIGGEVFGSPIVANANQADAWITALTAPIEIPVDFVEGKTVNFNEYSIGTFPGTITSGSVSIVKYDGQNVLYLSEKSKKGGGAYIVEGFPLVEGATYTATFWAWAEKDDASFNVTFSGNKIDGTATSDGKWQIPGGKWTKVVVEGKAAEDITEGYLQISMVRGSNMYIQKVEVGYYPDNHRPQTEEERTDNVMYALNTWCDGLMKINKGRIKSFDLIDEAIDNTVVLDNGMYDLKHSTNSNIFWQDVIGNENYAPTVDKVARESFAKYEGNPDDLKFFISESGLEDATKMESLKYWIGIWDKNGAKIDGITAKLNLVCYEDAAKQAEAKASYEALLSNLAATGKFIRVSNFDIKYVDANNVSVTPANITAEQRQTLADFNAYAIKAYMSKIPSDKQVGIVKSNIVDTSAEPVGLWFKDAKNSNDWTRSATYKAWCEALSGK